MVQVFYTLCNIVLSHLLKLWRLFCKSAQWSKHICLEVPHPQIHETFL